MNKVDLIVRTEGRYQTTSEYRGLVGWDPPSLVAQALL